MASLSIEVHSRVAGLSPDDLTLQPVTIELIEERISVAELIRRTVEEQVRDLVGRRRLDALQAQQALERQYLTNDEIGRQAQEGAVRFPKASKIAIPRLHPEAEVQKALAAFQRGSYLVLIDGRRVERLDEQVTFAPETRVTFLRIMPLAGGGAMLDRLIGRDPLRQRITELEREMSSWLGEVWNLDGRDILFTHPLPLDAICNSDDPLAPRLGECVRRLRARWTDGELGARAADMLLNPALWRPRYGSASNAATAMLHVLASCVIAIPPPDIYARLRARIAKMLAHPYDNFELDEQAKDRGMPHTRYWPPDLGACFQIWRALPVTPMSLDLMDDIVAGRMNSDPIETFDWAGRPVRLRSYALCHGSLELGYPWMLSHLFDAGRLDAAAFCHAAQYVPDFVREGRRLSEAAGESSYLHDRISQGFASVLPSYCDQFAWFVAENLNDDRVKKIKSFDNLRGSRYLIQAARHHSEKGMGVLVNGDIRWREGLDTAVIHMAGAYMSEPASDGERRDLVSQLSAFPRHTLLCLLPVARHGRPIVCEALGWQDAIALAKEICREGADDERFLHDVQAVRAALDRAGDRLAKEVLALFRAAHVCVDRVFLIEALRGWNRERIEKGAPRRHQLSVRALGLLPLQRGDDEVLERYTFFMRFAKESKQFGIQRQASERASAKAALHHLAQTAGYAGATRLEWAMESRLSAGVSALGRIWHIGDYEATLTLANMAPAVIYKRGDRRLGSAPEAVRRSAQYAEIRETVAALHDQLARFRATFEQMMIDGDMLSRHDLDDIKAIPAASALLHRLILRNEDGMFGLLDASGRALAGLDGAALALGPSVSIAHSYHLFQSGQLGGWQRLVVHDRIVQPFKQAFRELYVLTPAEEETGSFSNRFVGHVLKPHVASRLFQARGWSMYQLDTTVPHKVFAQAGVAAVFSFPDAGHYLAETDVITSDQVYFIPWDGGTPDFGWSPAGRPTRHVRWGELDDGRIHLSRVAPVIFSDVMRDADLVVSVAQTGDADLTSQETFLRRSQLVSVLVQDLGLPGVTVEGHFAHVQGQRARYRVHLGSAAIHIEPGHYLCVVPARWGQPDERLFLPFADANDMKASEVISKIFLLANDQAIKDPTILRQIEAQRAA